MKAKLLASALMVLSISSSAVYAEAYRCVGLDGEGNKITVLYDEATGSINVNGRVLKVEAATNDESGIATENFKRDDGMEVYVSLHVADKNKISLHQLKAADDTEVAVVPLACE